MSITSESKSQSLTVNGISADWEICSRLVPQAPKFHLRLFLLVERKKPCSQERRKKISSDQVIHAAEILPNMTTSAEKKPRPEKVHKEHKTEVSSFFSQYLIKNGKRTTSKHSTLQRISALLSRRIYILPTLALATSGLRS